MGRFITIPQPPSYGLGIGGLFELPVREQKSTCSGVATMYFKKQRLQHTYKPTKINPSSFNVLWKASTMIWPKLHAAADVRSVTYYCYQQAFRYSDIFK